MQIYHAKFITSALTIAKTPPDLVYPEIAVMGRSNVGKSSFLCSLTQHKGIAKTSSTPGKTRLINYFLIDEKWYLVDLPGYGYAKVSHKSQERWGRSMEEYLEKRQGLVLAVLLVDCRHEPKESDMQMYAWLQEQSYPTLLIMTKTDKISKNKVASSRKLFAQTFQLPEESILLYSSVTGAGRPEVLAKLGIALKSK